MCVCVCVCVCVCMCVWSGREEAASRKTCYFAWLFISHFSWLFDYWDNRSQGLASDSGMISRRQQWEKLAGVSHCDNWQCFACHPSVWRLYLTNSKGCVVPSWILTEFKVLSLYLKISDTPELAGEKWGTWPSGCFSQRWHWEYLLFLPGFARGWIWFESLVEQWVARTSVPQRRATRVWSLLISEGKGSCCHKGQENPL